jgi:peptidoglycan/LPS O-acetylase OafA/YrhL
MCGGLKHKASNVERCFVTLDGLRGIAALTIVIRHVHYFRSPFFESYLAVDFFFVLSGFVLSHAYGNKFRTTLSAREFIKIRLIRLYPLYALAVAIAAGVLISGAHYPIVAIFFSILFLPTPAISQSADPSPLVFTGWSLFFELIANAWWVIAWPRIRNIPLAIFVGAVALLMIVSVLTKSAGFGFASNTGVMDNGYQWGSIGAGFIRVGYSFFCGVLLHRIWATTNSHLRLPAWLPFIALVVVLTAKPPESYQAAFDLIATLFVFPLIVWIGASSPVAGTTAKVFSVLGVASYGVYILQGPAVEVFAHFTKGVATLAPSPAMVGIVFILLLFAFTIVADKYFDRPVRNWLTMKLKRSGGTMADSERKASTAR